MPRIRRSSPADPAAKPLLDGLAVEYERLYGAAADGELTTREVEEFLPPRGTFLVAVDDTGTVAGGGLAPLDEPAVAEVKRMWTAPERRGQGLARRVLAALEAEAAELGYRVLRLQTGSVAEAAVALYDRAGYRRIAPFGRYADEPLAVGFEKRLAG